MKTLDNEWYIISLRFWRFSEIFLALAYVACPRYF